MLVGSQQYFFKREAPMKRPTFMIICLFIIIALYRLYYSTYQYTTHVNTVHHMWGLIVCNTLTVVPYNCINVLCLIVDIIYLVRSMYGVYLFYHTYCVL